MKDGFKVFDSDMHVLEPPDLWERYIDPAFRDRAPRGSAESPMDVGVLVAFLEGNGSWLPFWLWRLDEHWENPGKYENPALELSPSEDFRRQCWVSIECEEWPARHAVDACGADCYVFSTDYPHYDTKYPEATARFLTLGFDAGSTRKILWDNCVRLYGIADD